MEQTMATEIVPTTTALPVVIEDASVHPVAVYLAGRAKSTACTMLRMLNSIARLTAGKAADAWTYPWPQLRQHHTVAIRAKLAEKYAPSSTNLHLSA